MARVWFRMLIGMRYLWGRGGPVRHGGRIRSVSNLSLIWAGFEGARQPGRWAGFFLGGGGVGGGAVRWVTIFDRAVRSDV